MPLEDGSLDAGVEGLGEPSSSFPLTREVLIQAAQPVSVAAMASTCTSLVLASQGLGDETNPHVAAVMSALLYAYLPIGIVGVLLGVAVKSHPRLVGLSSGFMLFHLVMPTILGGGVNVLKSNEEVSVAAPISVALALATVVAWSYSYLCSYPKFLRRFHRVDQRERTA